MAPLQSSRLQARVWTVAAGLTEEEAERTLGTQRTLGRMDPARLGARLAELSAQLPPQVVRKLVLTAPAVLYHDLTRSLPRKLAALSHLDEPAKLLERTPTLLLLEATRLERRRAQLVTLLGVDAAAVDALLRRAPRLLGSSEATLTARWEGLQQLDLPPPARAAELVAAQPTLLCSDVARRVAPKLQRLRGLRRRPSHKALLSSAGSGVGPRRSAVAAIASCTHHHRCLPRDDRCLLHHLHRSPPFSSTAHLRHQVQRRRVGAAGAQPRRAGATAHVLRRRDLAP